MGTKTCSANADLSLALKGVNIKKSVQTYQLSKKYVNRLVKISLLNIVYRRVNIARDEFELRSYPSPYFVFKKKSQNPFIKLYKSAGQGIVDALQKDYLKEVRMHLIHKDNGELLETYTLKVKYNKKDAKASRRTSDAKNATVEFLEALSNLPGKILNESAVKVEFELLYNEGTPQEYEPPFFQAAKGQIRDVTFSQCVALGNVDTGFHKISSYGRGKNFLISRATTPISLVESINEEPKNNVVELDPLKRRNEDDENPVLKKAKISNQTSCSRETWFDTICSAEAISLSSSEDGIQCLCEWSLPKQFSQIRCSHCFSRVHLACHGYLKEKDIKKEKFLCFYCSDNKTHISLPSLKRLMKLRIILFGLHVNKIIPEEIKCATGDDMTFLLTKLEEFGILQKKNSTDNCWADFSFEAVEKSIKTVFYCTNSEIFE